MAVTTKFTPKAVVLSCSLITVEKDGPAMAPIGDVISVDLGSGVIDDGMEDGYVLQEIMELSGTLRTMSLYLRLAMLLGTMT